KRLEPLDPTLARETYLEVFAAGLSTDRLARGGDVCEVAAAVLTANWKPSTRAPDLLLDGLALLISEGYVAAAPALTIAVRAFRAGGVPGEDDWGWLGVARRAARPLGDCAAWEDLTAPPPALARRSGAFSLLPVALADRVVVELASGRIDAATALAA